MYLSIRVHILGFLIHQAMVGVEGVDDYSSRVNVHWVGPRCRDTRPGAVSPSSPFEDQVRCAPTQRDA